jgi:transposase
MSTIPGVPLSGGVRVLIAAKPVDFRKGANGLAALAKEVLAQDPFSGAVIVFRAKRTDRVKILLWDGSGLLLVWKRLENGGFKWPPIMDGMMQLSPAQLAALIEGLDWTRVHVPEIVRPIAVQ